LIDYIIIYFVIKVNSFREIFMDINKLLEGVKCSCGKTHLCNIKAVYVEDGAIARLPEYLKGYSRVLLVADGNTYLAVIPASDSLDELQLEVSILKSVEEGGESILCTIDDEAELQAVYDLIMDELYEEEK
jgi:hypothetical protein